MKYLFLIHALCFYYLGYSQTPKTIRYDYYRFTDEVIKQLDSNTKSQAYHNYQLAATYLSWIGEYEKDLMIWDWPREKTLYLTPSEYYYIKTCDAIDAKAYILDQVKNRKIVMINEEHHQPQDRVFAESLLPELYQMGFRFFGAETLAHEDIDLNNRGYPVLNTGYYTKEPEFGNLIRTAIKTGFTVFAYEQKYSAEQNTLNRDWAEAQNVKDFLDKNPGAKIVIYCGYSHLSKTPIDSGLFKTPMAYSVKKLTGIDPFCIDQTSLIEKSCKEFESRSYKVLDFDNCVVLKDSNGKIFNGFIGLDSIQDISVYHPHTKWIIGRPNWVFENGREPFILKKKIKTSYPCLVFAYADGENISDAVPVDIIELKSEKDKKALALSKGSYTVVIKDKNGKEQTIKIKR